MHPPLPLLLALLSQAQTPSDEGFPVTSELVVAKCSPCHKKDDKGNLTRISWIRATPEGWQQVIKRMVRLQNLQLTPDEARHVVRYLSTSHGLAPEEARLNMYEVERRMIDETLPDQSLKDACVICHSHGRAMSWRRTKDEWQLLINMHLGYFPVAEFQGFRRPPPRASDPPPPPGTDTRDNADKAVDWLAKNYPLHTPEWAAWRAGMRAPRLAGRWLIIGSQTGRGPVYGDMTVEPGASPDEFTTRTTLRFVAAGKTVTASGRSIVYTGYAWRGRVENAAKPADPGDLAEARQVMLVSRDQSQMEGRWFWGGYDEFGLDVKLVRAGNNPLIFGVDRPALRAGATAQRVRIYGENLPSGLRPDEIDFGAGVTVRGVVSGSPGDVVVDVDVATSAMPGRRDVAVRGAVATAAYAVFDKIDYLKVTPEAALARLGGNSHPKGYQLFDAFAWHRGADGKPNTPDDVNLGRVEVEWSVEEFLAVYGDDDKDFVGTLSPAGFFTPASEGPNPKRKFSRNNYGDIWVVGSLKNAPADISRDGKPLAGRAHLVVTIPLYLRWDQPEVSR
ncbi:MAG: quinohemoprotein amine dehydrogenase subunit alpha [Bryobacteraceae bacterium]